MDRRVVNDEQLTAYALGELEGAEWAAAEQRIAEDPAARRYVEEVRAEAKQMSDGLSALPSPGLDDANKEAIEDHIEIRSRSQYGPGPSSPLISKTIMIAFVALLAFGFFAMMYGPKFGKSLQPQPATQPTIQGHIPVTIEHELETTQPAEAP
jgi:anti-sigma factor RsiW